MLDQLLAGSDDSGLTYERAVALLGYTDDSLLDEVADAFAAGDGAAVFRAVDRVVEAGHDPRRFAADLLDRLRDLIVLDAVPDAADTGLLDIPADRLERMRDQAARFGQAQLARAAETINAGLVEMRGATSPRLQLELICAQVLLPGESDLLARLERLERALASGAPVSQAGPARPAARPEDAPAASAARARPGRSLSPGCSATPGRSFLARRPAPSRRTARARREPPSAKPEPAAAADQPRPAAAAPVAPGALDAGALRERWPMILDAVKHEKRVAWLLLSNASVDSLSDGVLTLRFTREGEAKGFSGSGYDQELGKVLQNMLGISPRVRAVASPSGGPGHPGRPGRTSPRTRMSPRTHPGAGPAATGTAAPGTGNGQRGRGAAPAGRAARRAGPVPAAAAHPAGPVPAAALQPGAGPPARARVAIPRR